MTTIPAPSVRATVTPFERALLHAATAMDSYVGRRLERRAGPAGRRASAVQAAAASARDAAQARGSIGILPR